MNVSARAGAWPPPPSAPSMTSSGNRDRGHRPRRGARRTAGDATAAAHAQAALGDAIWAVIVPAACIPAGTRTGSCCGLPVAGCPRRPGKPVGRTQDRRDRRQLDALLAALDAMPASGSNEAASLIEEGTDATTARRHAPRARPLPHDPGPDHVLHPAARELDASRITKKIEDVPRIVAESGVRSLRERLASAYLLLDAVHRLQDKRQAFRSACLLLAKTRTRTGRRSTTMPASQPRPSNYSAGSRPRKPRSTTSKQLAAAEGRLQEAERQLTTLTSRRLAAELTAQEPRCLPASLG